MNERYFDLMERTLDAYGEERIRTYFENVRREGLTEHGFPRLCANVGILIAHGRKAALRPLFLEMMDLCTEQIPKVKAANDFSVREVILCLREIKRTGAFPLSDVARWEKRLAEIRPEECYTVYATKEEDKLNNWGLFTALSEWVRISEGIGGSVSFVETQLASQRKMNDENGMYMDPDCPIVYDLVPRGLYSLLLCLGYRGEYAAEIDENLRRAGRITLGMQSVSGEIAYGGRSNQFLFNEALLAAIGEYEAARYEGENEPELAARFRAMTDRALDRLEAELSNQPIHHVKNRYPSETGYGCEFYAYFDKYMITAASYLYTAALIGGQAAKSTARTADGTAGRQKKPNGAHAERTAHALWLNSDFHKIFLSCGDYHAEIDYAADTHYDASGLGRLHRAGCPSPICLSCPGAKDPNYTLDLQNTRAFSIAPGICRGGEMRFGSEGGAEWRVISVEESEADARALLNCTTDTDTVRVEYRLDATGLSVSVTGDGEVGILLPLFDFDGEMHTTVCISDASASVEYKNARVVYEADGEISDLGETVGNRNGHCKLCAAHAAGRVGVHVSIDRL